MFNGRLPPLVREYRAREDDPFTAALWFDDAESFVSLIDHELYARYEDERPSPEELAIELIGSVCRFPSLKCAKALINGETTLKDIDMNCRDAMGVYPIHHAAWSCCPNITNLFLDKGALPNIQCEADDPSFNKKLPIMMPLKRLSQVHFCINNEDVFSLLLTFCHPREIHALRTTALLASKTNFKELEEELYRLARDGKLLEFAGLLIAAHKKLKDPILKIREFVSANKDNVLIDENRKQSMSFVHDLLDVLETEGDAMEAHFMEQPVVAVEEDHWNERTLRQIIRPGHEWHHHSPMMWRKIQKEPKPKLVLDCPELRTHFMTRIGNDVRKRAKASATLLNFSSVSCINKYFSPFPSVPKGCLF